ncbi:NAD(P)/FAD-dependent oxidoreductase [Propionicimonas sp.]|uniref:NAD(P)/FAD-dependent oxidoreductase n=1 Tax=Propionicimonas sp. TaxID=1955623 RepID=UPI0039E50A6E
MRYLIIGGGLAAAKAVEGIREHDRDSDIRLVTEEAHLPYERPPLSKDVLGEKAEIESVFPHPASWYADQGVGLVLGDPVASIDPVGRTATLHGGGLLPWDRALVATGSQVRRLGVPGADLPGIHYLRTIDESLALLSRLREGGDVVVVGGGWIGLEVAAAARAHDCRVTLIEPQAAPLEGVVGPTLGAWFAQLHEAHGVQLRLGTGVVAFTGDGRVNGVVTEGDVTIPADVVVVGVGIRPRTELAASAGAQVEDGVLTDARLRTSVDGLWAAGDVARWDSTLFGRRLRVEHWANALDGGLAAGRSMAGADVIYDPVPFFFSDQYDAGLEYAGYVPPDAGAELVVRGDPRNGEFMAFWVVPEGSGVRLLAGMHVNTWDTMDAVQDLIRRRAVVATAALADPSVPLPELS